MPLVALVCAAPALGDEPTMRLRIAWGGGEARQWIGRIALSHGTLDALQPLGLEADEPGSIALDRNVVEIHQPTVRAFDGGDLSILAPLSARLNIDLAPRNEPDRGRKISIPLDQVVSGFSNTDLDQQGNRLLIRRAPGDALRVKLDRDSLVLAPNETLSLEVIPHLIADVTESSSRVTVELLEGRGSGQLYISEHDLRTNDDGSFAPVGPVHITMPNREGVYDVVISVVERRLRNRFVASQPTMQRKLQLVVIDPDEPVGSGQAGPEEEVSHIDPANPSWWERFARPLNVIPGFDQQKPLHNGKSRIWEHAGERFVQLEPDGWQAYALSIFTPGTPHILEVSYPADQPQTLGISIIEPNAAGQVTPIGLDSGVVVNPQDGDQQPNILRHRLIFWPRTETPFVLLTNRRTDTQAVYGRIRVVTAPRPARPSPPAGDDSAKRLVAAYFAKPLFPENFCASEALDVFTGHSLDDWLTFYEGGSRLADYLSRVGFNGAVIPVLCEGSTIYPSRVLEPTPRYDSGTFFVSGQDPFRKDVLEMLLRIFDRNRLRFIPSLEFTSPLVRLEQRIRRGGPDAVGLRLVGPEGLTWTEANGTNQGRAPYYNPLDERVQEAMLEVVRELVARCTDHPSFGGLALTLSPDGFAQLPGSDWGLDDRTVARFEQATQVQISAEGPRRYAQRATYLKQNDDARGLWLNWRAERLAEFYRQVQLEISTRRPGTRLFLAGPEMLKGSAIQDSLRPTLPLRLEKTVAQGILQLGIRADGYRDDDNIVLLRPQHVGRSESTPNSTAQWDINDAPEVDAYFRQSSTPASLLFRPPRPLRVPSFDEASPFGRDKTYTRLVSQFSDSGYENRRRFCHSLATLDSSVIFDGGWMLSLGQEDALRDLLDVIRQLPSAQFQSISGEVSLQPVVARMLTRENETYVYLVNDSPWSVTADLELIAPMPVQITPLGSRHVPQPLFRQNEGIWKVPLAPYDLVAVRIDSAQVTVRTSGVTLPDKVRNQLKVKIDDVRARAIALKNPPPLNEPLNPGFEQPGVGIPGWVHARGTGIVVQIDTAVAHTGGQSVNLSSDGPVTWLRSDAFDPPQTGRFSFWVWLRVPDEQTQPRFRLALEGKYNGKNYYRFAEVGGPNDIRLTSQWKRYVFHVDDLPHFGLNDMRVGFDLMEPGAVWIDDVQAYDLSFTRAEQHEIFKIVARASFLLREGRISDCTRDLEGYWPRFLTHNVRLEPIAVAVRPQPVPAPLRQPVPNLPAIHDPRPPAESAQEERPLLERLRDYLPSIPRFGGG